MVEFALVMPIFLLLVFGAIEFGRVYLRLHLMTNAAREGARAGSLPSSVEDDVTDAVDSFLTAVGMTGSWNTTTVVTDSDDQVRAGGLADAEQGDHVEVAISHDFQVLVGSVIPGLQGTFELTSGCVFRHE